MQNHPQSQTYRFRNLQKQKVALLLLVVEIKCKKKPWIYLSTSLIALFKQDCFHHKPSRRQLFEWETLFLFRLPAESFLVKISKLAGTK